MRSHHFYQITLLHCSKPTSPLSWLQSVVPQLSGKSAILRKLVPDGIDEISVDDVPQSYEKVPIGVVLTQLDQPNSSHVSSSAEEFVDKNTYGQSVFSRIAELKETEQGLLIKLFTGSVSFTDSEAALRASVSESDREIFLRTIKGALKHNSKMVRDFSQLEQFTCLIRSSLYWCIKTVSLNCFLQVRLENMYFFLIEVHIFLPRMSPTSLFDLILYSPYPFHFVLFRSDFIWHLLSSS